eukprot:TRINITY_DN27104_c0_g2_i4.p1 TRINITY_DN27104_c0_g2~~TRINITY_DN27104_c0_g2_i4.p1  ORF type:complete len:394 (+),score=114.59 TRINITY_DN27104_c0_g2_i4:63-1244(+)
MTEFWVSQARHYCKFCKCWLSGHKANIRNHDMTPGHKANEEKYFSKISRDKKGKVVMNQQVQNELAEMNRRAHSAMGRAAPTLPTRENPMPIAPKSIGSTKKGGIRGNHHHAPAPPASMLAGAPPPPPESRVRGMYTIDGMEYLEAKYHQHRLVEGAEIEAFYENEEADTSDWFDAVIEKVQRKVIKGTDMEVREFRVRYVNYDFSEVVPIERMRFVVPPDAPNLPQNEEVAEMAKRSEEILKQKVAEKVDDFGFGDWETVNVREISKEEEKKENEANKELENQMRTNQVEGTEPAKKRFREEEEDAESGDAMAAFNPLGGNTYRGIVVDVDAKQGSEITVVPTKADKEKGKKIPAEFKTKVKRERKRQIRGRRRRSDSDSEDSNSNSDSDSE